jgi:hypothetical protein
MESKAILVTGRGGLQGCEMSRIPHCLDNRLGFSALDTGCAFPPEILWYSFLLRLSKLRSLGAAGGI